MIFFKILKDLDASNKSLQQNMLEYNKLIEEYKKLSAEHKLLYKTYIKLLNDFDIVKQKYKTSLINITELERKL